MSRELVLDTRVTDIGALAPGFFAEGMVVLFGEEAPPELREICVLHAHPGLARDVVPGNHLFLGPTEARITAVGNLANRNLRELGHAVFKFNGHSEPELPGDICVEAVPVPALQVGDRIRIG